jgi:hypothetical protein
MIHVLRSRKNKTTKVDKVKFWLWPHVPIYNWKGIRGKFYDYIWVILFTEKSNTQTKSCTWVNSWYCKTNKQKGARESKSVWASLWNMPNMWKILYSWLEEKVLKKTYKYWLQKMMCDPITNITHFCQFYLIKQNPRNMVCVLAF